ncbi:MAG: HPr kinase/phosphatase C-terminal domain-containing protein [Loktanella sp.]|nr:HPr kinase/phosphatase C-terminal domain-containing protein [Loktanella sp.]
MADGETRHASCVAWADRAVVILGAAGQGKSGLALQLMALGCTLVADDRVILRRDGDMLIAACPPAIAGLIEARGVGILTAKTQPKAQVVLVVDLNETEAKRLPDRRWTRISGLDLPLIARVDVPHFAAIILQLLRSGWSDA